MLSSPYSCYHSAIKIPSINESLNTLYSKVQASASKTERQEQMFVRLLKIYNLLSLFSEYQCEEHMWHRASISRYVVSNKLSMTCNMNVKFSLTQDVIQHEDHFFSCRQSEFSTKLEKRRSKIEISNSKQRNKISVNKKLKRSKVKWSKSLDTLVQPFIAYFFGKKTRPKVASKIKSWVIFIMILR